MTQKIHAPAPRTAPGSATAGPRGLVDVRRRPHTWTGLWFVLPFLAFYALFLLWPAIIGFGYTFTDRSLAGGDVSFIGLDNWSESLTDSAMYDSLWNTLWFTILSVPLMVCWPWAWPCSPTTRAASAGSCACRSSPPSSCR